MTIDSIMAAAQKEVGNKEYPANSNNVKYNTWFYGKEVSGPNYPWCCAFIAWLFRGTTLVKRTASCSDLMAWFKMNSQMVERPQRGDIIFFKYKTNNRDTNHVGIVKDATQWPKTIVTIEGNTSIRSNDNGGAVMERVRSKSNIVGFARPKYEDAKPSVTPTTTVGVKNKPVLKMGDKGDWVKVAQARLFVNGHHIEVDGVFGQNTKNAVIAFQGTYGLTKDGVIGPKTWAKLYP